MSQLETRTRGAAFTSAGLSCLLPQRAGAQLVGIGAALRSARLLRAALRDGAAAPPLQALAEDLRGAEMLSRGGGDPGASPAPESGEAQMVETALERAVFQSLSDPVGAVLDTASPALADIRSRRAESGRALMQLLTQLSQRLERAKACERAQVVSRRDRLAIPLKAGMTGSVPGCVVLDTSSSGLTLFVEPPEAVELNNLQAELEVAEQEEVARVLHELSNRVRKKKTALRAVLRAVAAIDLAFARARHAQWTGSARPRFARDAGAAAAGEEEGEAAGEAAPAVRLLELRHPLLLAASLEPPALRHWEEDTPLLVAEMRRGTYLAPPAPPEEEQQQQRGGPALSPPRQKQQQQIKGDPFWSPAAAAPRPAAGGADDSDDEEGGAEAAGELGPVTLGPPPKPIDMTVPGGARVVVITGPNAGGKTASMKALALSTLMARAGMFVPAAPGCVVPWASKVMADLGDAQSLSGGLSTFSGHVARLTRILNALRPGRPRGESLAGEGGAAGAAAEAAPRNSGGPGESSGRGNLERGAKRPAAAGNGGAAAAAAEEEAEPGASVVLLDEPGGGTDPKEGAALATALLECLADRASLTIATSHYEEAKALALGGDRR